MKLEGGFQVSAALSHILGFTIIYTVQLKIFTEQKILPSLITYIPLYCGNVRWNEFLPMWQSIDHIMFYVISDTR